MNSNIGRKSDRMRLLIVEDNQSLAENLFEFFGEERYVLDFAADGHTAINLALSNEYDVIVLDVMLPGISGFEVCHRLRSATCLVPIILVTAKDRIEDRVDGLERGADDYLVKPFDLRELKARIEALHRRKRSGAKEIRAGKLSFDIGTVKVRLDDQEALQLSGINAMLFECLIRAYPNIVTHEALHEMIWPDKESDINLRTHIYNLRKALEEAFNLPLIKTIHGRGYRLVSPGET